MFWLDKQQSYSLQVHKVRPICCTFIYQPFHFQLLLASVKMADNKKKPNFFFTFFFSNDTFNLIQTLKGNKCCRTWLILNWTFTNKKNYLTIIALCFLSRKESFSSPLLTGGHWWAHQATAWSSQGFWPYFPAFSYQWVISHFPFSCAVCIHVYLIFL